MPTRLAVALVVLLSVLVATPAVAAPAFAASPDIRALKLKQTVLADRKVSGRVKAYVRADPSFGGGIANPVYADLTGDGAEDVLVPIASGGSAGVIAFYVYSYHTGALQNLLVRNEVYRVGLRVKRGDLVVTYPLYGNRDPNCCPSRLDRRTLHFNGQRFRVIRSVIIHPRY
jgi:hypothetical protein